MCATVAEEKSMLLRGATFVTRAPFENLIEFQKVLLICFLQFQKPFSKWFTRALATFLRNLTLLFIFLLCALSISSYCFFLFVRCFRPLRLLFSFVSVVVNFTHFERQTTSFHFQQIQCHLFLILKLVISWRRHHVFLFAECRWQRPRVPNTSQYADTNNSSCCCSGSHCRRNVLRYIVFRLLCNWLMPFLRSVCYNCNPRHQNLSAHKQPVQFRSLSLSFSFSLVLVLYL